MAATRQRTGPGYTGALKYSTVRSQLTGKTTLTLIGAQYCNQMSCWLIMALNVTTLCTSRLLGFYVLPTGEMERLK